MEDKTVTIRTRTATHQALYDIAAENRLSLIDTLDVLVDGWKLLVESKQTKAIRKGARVRQQHSAQRNARRTAR